MRPGRRPPFAARAGCCGFVLAAILLAALVLQAGTAYRSALQRGRRDVRLPPAADGAVAARRRAAAALRRRSARRRGGLRLVRPDLGPGRHADLPLGRARRCRRARCWVFPTSRRTATATASIRCRRRCRPCRSRRTWTRAPARARALALRAVLPIALMAPLLMLVVWWVISALAGAGRSARGARWRGAPADDLSPLADAGLPDEVRPLVRRTEPAVRPGARCLRRAEELRRRRRARTALAADGAQAAGAGAARAPAKRRRRAARPPSQRLNQGIDRAIRLVEQLLVLARQEAERRAPRRRSRSTCEALARAGGRRRAAAGRGAAHRPRPGATGAGHAGAVQGEPRRCGSCCATCSTTPSSTRPRAARSTCRSRRAGRRRVLAVEDSGPGIAEAERERVFDRFYRAGGSRSPAAAAWGWRSCKRDRRPARRDGDAGPLASGWAGCAWRCASRPTRRSVVR